MRELRIQWFCLKQLITLVGRERRYLTFISRKAFQRRQLPSTVLEQSRSSWLREERENALWTKGARREVAWHVWGATRSWVLFQGQVWRQASRVKLKGWGKGNREPLRGWGNEGTRSNLHSRPISWWSTGEDRLGEARPKLGRSGRRPLQSPKEKSVRL